MSDVTTVSRGMFEGMLMVYVFCCFFFVGFVVLRVLEY